MNVFNPNAGLIVVVTTLHGPSGRWEARLALDTGASTTLVRPAILVAIGHDPASALDRIQVTTGSGVEYLPRLEVDGVSALGLDVARLPVVAHTLPPSATVDGLLGLDFMRGRTLTVDFRTGRISLV